MGESDGSSENKPQAKDGFRKRFKNFLNPHSDLSKIKADAERIQKLKDQERAKSEERERFICKIIDSAIPTLEHRFDQMVGLPDGSTNTSAQALLPILDNLNKTGPDDQRACWSNFPKEVRRAWSRVEVIEDHYPAEYPLVRFRSRQIGDYFDLHELPKGKKITGYTAEANYRQFTDSTGQKTAMLRECELYSGRSKLHLFRYHEGETNRTVGFNITVENDYNDNPNNFTVNPVDPQKPTEPEVGREMWTTTSRDGELTLDRRYLDHHVSSLEVRYDRVDEGKIMASRGVVETYVWSSYGNKVKLKFNIVGDKVEWDGDQVKDLQTHKPKYDEIHLPRIEVDPETKIVRFFGTYGTQEGKMLSEAQLVVDSDFFRNYFEKLNIKTHEQLNDYIEGLQKD